MQMQSITIRNHSAQTGTVPHTSIYMDLLIQAIACMSVVFFFNHVVVMIRCGTMLVFFMPAWFDSRST